MGLFVLQLNCVKLQGCSQLFIECLQAQVAFAKIREVQDRNKPKVPAAPPADGKAPAASPADGKAPAASPADGQAPAASPADRKAPATSPADDRAPAASLARDEGDTMREWKDALTGWVMSERDTEIPPLGTLTVDYIILAAGMSIAHRGTERFMSCAPMQVLCSVRVRFIVTDNICCSRLRLL